MENFLAGQLAGKLTGAAAAGEQKNGIDDKAIPAQAAAEVLRVNCKSFVKLLRPLRRS
jgi:hypothetical protein